jgi:hypothetical protein
MLTPFCVCFWIWNRTLKGKSKSSSWNERGETVSRKEKLGVFCTNENRWLKKGVKVFFFVLNLHYLTVGLYKLIDFLLLPPSACQHNDKLSFFVLLQLEFFSLSWLQIEFILRKAQSNRNRKKRKNKQWITKQPLFFASRLSRCIYKTIRTSGECVCVCATNKQKQGRATATAAVASVRIRDNTLVVYGNA